MVSPMPSLEEDGQAGRRGDDALHGHARLGEAEVQRVVAARGEPAVDVDQVLHAADLGAEDDPVVAQPGGFGQLGRTEGGGQHRLDHHVAGVARGRQAGVLVHQLGQQLLVERAPVDADADRLALLDRDADDGLEVLVVPLGAHVAGVDAVLVEGRRHGRVLGQQLVPVVVEVADDRHPDAQPAQPCARSPARPPPPHRC